MENLEQMTLEQLTTLQKEKAQRYNELNEQIIDVRNDLLTINPILAKKMSKCSPLIGKKVKVVSRPRLWSTEPSIIMGFFGGYFAHAYGTIAIYPIIYKIKKDGKSSKNKYSEYDVPSFERIISIEEVTE